MGLSVAHQGPHNAGPTAPDPPQDKNSEPEDRSGPWSGSGLEQRFSLQRAFKGPGDLVNVQIRIQWVCGGARDSAFL